MMVLRTAYNVIIRRQKEKSFLKLESFPSLNFAFVSSSLQNMRVIPAASILLRSLMEL